MDCPLWPHGSLNEWLLRKENEGVLRLLPESKRREIEANMIKKYNAYIDELLGD